MNLESGPARAISERGCGLRKTIQRYALLARHQAFRRFWLGMMISLIACGAPLFGLLRFAPDLPVAAVLLGLATFCLGPYFALDRTLTQRLVPDDVRGRLVGARMTVSSLGFPLGSAIGGALIGAAGAPTMILR